MLTNNHVALYDFVAAISEVAHIISTDLNNHNKETAYISWRIAQKMGLVNDEMRDVVMASMLHDIGAFSIEERSMIIQHECAFIHGEEHFDVNHHAVVGYNLLKDFTPLANVAQIIRYHHTDYDPSNDDIPICSYIIRLADRVSLLFDKSREALEQVPDLRKRLAGMSKQFHPMVHEALEGLTQQITFWIEAFLVPINIHNFKTIRFSNEIADTTMLNHFSKMVSQIIDFRNPFTATHSGGVATIASELAALFGFSKNECHKIGMSGLLHDLGKLSVPSEILDKEGPLTDNEYNIIRKHPYYTFNVLNKIKGFEEIAVWASYHHERLDGSGYPFNVTGAEYPLLSRILAVADIMTALSEDRPYRKGMEYEEVKRTMNDMAKKNILDSGVVKILMANYSHINALRMKAQNEKRIEYDAFYKSTH